MGLWTDEGRAWRPCMEGLMLELSLKERLDIMDLSSGTGFVVGNGGEQFFRSQTVT